MIKIYFVIHIEATCMFLSFLSNKRNISSINQPISLHGWSWNPQPLSFLVQLHPPSPENPAWIACVKVKRSASLGGKSLWGLSFAVENEGSNLQLAGSNLQVRLIIFDFWWWSCFMIIDDFWCWCPTILGGKVLKVDMWFSETLVLWLVWRHIHWCWEVSATSKNQTQKNGNSSYFKPFFWPIDVTNSWSWIQQKSGYPPWN